MKKECTIIARYEPDEGAMVKALRIVLNSKKKCSLDTPLEEKSSNHAA